MRKGLKLGDCSHARHRVLLGSIARMKNVCLDISVRIKRVRGLGRVVVLLRRCTLLIGVKVGYRGTLVCKFVSSFWCETEVSAVGYCKIIN
jgi:hypothetical protein